MSSPRQGRALPVLALLVCAACNGGAGQKPPGGGTTQPPSPPATAPVARQVSALFVDAATGAPTASPLTVAVRDASGKLSTATRGASGAAQSVFTTSSGVVSFAVDPAAALPVKLKIVAQGDGYNSASADVTLERDGAVAVTTPMVNVSAPPPGVAVSQVAAGTIQGGATAAPISVQTQADATSAGQVVVVVPEATSIRSATGQALSGALQATVSYYSNAQASSLAAFPGGLDVSGVAQQDGTKQDGVFVSGGFTAIQITDEAGNTAASFDKPLTVNVTVPAGTVNPDTGLPVKDGDVIPFWSYDETTGQWKSEGLVTLHDDGAGNFTATPQVSHLSYFNLDWFQKPCATPVTVIITGNPANLPLELELVATGGGFYKKHSTDPSDPNTVSFRNAGLPDAQREIKITASYQGGVVGSTIIPNICAGGQQELPVVIPEVKPATLTTTVMRVCQEDASRRAPIGSATVIAALKSVGATRVFGTTDANGQASFAKLVSGVGDGYDISYAPMGGDFQTTSIRLSPGANALELDVKTACDVAGGPAPIENRAPVITSLVLPKATVRAGDAMTLAAAASDPDGDPLTYVWSATCKDAAQVVLATPGSASTVVTAAGGAGTCTVNLVVSDGKLAATRSVTVAVAAGDRAPVIAAVVVPRSRLFAGESMSLSVDAADPDGDPLAYAWSAACSGGAAAALDAPALVSTRFAASGVGSCAVTVRVSANGLSDARTVTVDVAAVPDRPPVVNALTGPSTLVGGTAGTFSVDAADPDGDALTYLWSVLCTGTVKVALSAPMAAATQLQASGAGTCAVTVKATANALSATASATLTVVLAVDRPPAIQAFDVPTSVVAGTAAPVSVQATDPDGDAIAYAWAASACTGTAKIAFAAPAAASTQLQPSGSGTCDVTATASAKALSDSRKVTVAIAPPPDRPPVIQGLSVPSALVAGGSATVSVDAADPDGDALAFAWKASCTGTTAAFTAPAAQSTALQVGTTAGSCTVTVEVSSNGLAVTRSATVDVAAAPPVDQPPVITKLSAPGSTWTGHVEPLSVDASDPDGDPLSYAWKADCTAGLTAALAAPSAAVTTFQAAGTGSCTVTVTVTAKGLSASRSAVIDVRADRPPTIAAVSAPATVVTGDVATLAVDASDPDGDPLSYLWSASCAAGMQVDLATPSAMTTQLRATSGTGRCTVTVQVSANGASVSQSATLDVLPGAGTIGVDGVFVPQPRVGNVTLGGATFSCSIDRAGSNATCLSRAAAGATLSGSFTFDAFAGPPATAAVVTDSCGGVVADTTLAPADGRGAFSWTAPPKAAVCLITVRLTRDALSDEFPIALGVVLAN